MVFRKCFIPSFQFKGKLLSIIIIKKKYHEFNLKKENIFTNYYHDMAKLRKFVAKTSNKRNIRKTIIELILEQ